jgi:mRNA-degrading endonuclease RelE of RelBE toxin-antitoxin system
MALKVGSVPMSEPYEIRYAAEAADDIRSLRKFDQRKVLAGVELHLAHQPRLESKSRIKAMVQPFWSQYRLRIDDFRVYYDVTDEPRRVNVLRVLQKTTQSTPEESP